MRLVVVSSILLFSSAVRGSVVSDTAIPREEPAETRVVPGVEVFAQYGYTRTLGQTTGSSWYHQLDVPRAWAYLDAERGVLRGRVLLEGVRSASEGALIGVSGDSLVLRFREAWAGVKPHQAIDLRAGLVSTFVVPFLDDAFRLRVLNPTQVEAGRLLSPADVGVQARLELPRKYGVVVGSWINGEGYTSRELNRGKTSEIGAAIVPVPGGAAEPFTVMLAYQSGSTGATSSRADRLSGGLLWRGDAIRGGASVTYGAGLEDDGSRKTLIAEASVRARPWSHLLAAARASYFARDSRNKSDVLRTVQLGLGWEIDSGAETWISVVRQSPGSAAREALPGSDRWELRVALKATF